MAECALAYPEPAPVVALGSRDVASVDGDVAELVDRRRDGRMFRAKPLLLNCQRAARDRIGGRKLIETEQHLGELYERICRGELIVVSAMRAAFAKCDRPFERRARGIESSEVFIEFGGNDQQASLLGGFAAERIDASHRASPCARG